MLRSIRWVIAIMVVSIALITASTIFGRRAHQTGPQIDQIMAVGQQIPALDGFATSEQRDSDAIIYEGRTRCLPASVMKNAGITLIRVARGGQSIPGLLVGPEDYHVASVVSLKGNVTRANPQLVVLISQSGVVWDFSRVSNAGLRGVVILGGIQAVSNLSGDVPIVFVDTPAKEKACNITRTRSASLVDEVQTAFGLPVQQVLWKEEPFGISLDNVDYDVVGDGTVRLNNIRTAGRFIATDVEPRALGMAALQRSGAVRIATDDDVNEWRRAARDRRNQKGAVQAPVHPHLIGPKPSYVALQEVTLPPGQHGENAVNVFIPVGVPAPIDLGSQNTYYYMKDGSCRGARASGCYLDD